MPILLNDKFLTKNSDEEILRVLKAEGYISDYVLKEEENKKFFSYDLRSI